MHSVWRGHFDKYVSDPDISKGTHLCDFTNPLSHNLRYYKKLTTLKSFSSSPNFSIRIIKNMSTINIAIDHNNQAIDLLEK